MTHIIAILLTPLLFLFQAWLSRVKEELERLVQKAERVEKEAKERVIKLRRHGEGLSYSAKGPISGLEPLVIRYRLKAIREKVDYVHDTSALISRRYERLMKVPVIVLGPWALTSAIILAYRWGWWEITDQQGVLLALPLSVATLIISLLFLLLVTSRMGKVRHLLDYKLQAEIEQTERKLHSYLWRV